MSFRDDWTMGVKNRAAITRRVTARTFGKDLCPRRVYTIKGVAATRASRAVRPGAPAKREMLAR